MSGVRGVLQHKPQRRSVSLLSFLLTRGSMSPHGTGGQRVVGAKTGSVAPWRNESSGGLAWCFSLLGGRVTSEGWYWVGEIAHPPVQTGLLTFWSSKHMGLGSGENSCLDRIAEGPGWKGWKHVSQNIGLSKQAPSLSHPHHPTQPFPSPVSAC